MLSKYNVVVFDWDGTVMDSIGHIVACIQAAAAEFELSVPNEQSVRDIIGMSLPNAYKKLFSQEAEHMYDAYRDTYKNLYHTQQNGHSPMFNNVSQLIKRLHGKGKSLAVATGKGRNGLDLLLQSSGLAQYFSYSRTSDEAQSKPHPDMLHQIMTYFDAEPHECVMIGDSIHDLNMAKNADMDAIGVTFGAHSREKLRETHPTAIVDSYDELLSGLM